ncbi:MAG: TonB family protein [Vicinamibacterales bacterium]
MTHPTRLAVPSLLVIALVMIGTPAWAADPALDQAKTLYAAASFEDALAAIGRVAPAQSAEPEVLLYKALCLLALGRPQEAGVATRTLVNAAPGYAPDTTELPPRFQTLWTDTRKAALPGVSREMFGRARTQYQAKDFIPALGLFEQVLALTNDPAWKDTPEATDLRTLASGFIDLAQAAIPKPEPGPPPAAVAVAPPPAPRPEPIVITAAVIVRQDLPRWSPPDRTIARMNFDGAVRVTIDATGKVTSASIVRPTHPSYDVQLLRTARDWSYRPATRNGQPIESEKTVEVHLAAAQEE